MSQRIGRVPFISWAGVATAAASAALGALWVTLTPTAEQTELADRTWEEFAEQDPEFASLYSMDLRILGMLGTGLGLLSAIVSVVPYRHGERWAWYALWLLPVSFGGAAARMLADRYSAGYVYAAISGVAVLGLLLPARSFLRSGGVGLPHSE